MRTAMSEMDQKVPSMEYLTHNSPQIAPAFEPNEPGTPCNGLHARTDAIQHAVLPYHIDAMK